MCKIITTIFFAMFIAITASAQLDTVKGLQIAPVIQPYTYTTTSFTNNGDEPATIFPLYGVKGMEYVFYNDSTYTTWLKSIATSRDSDIHRLQMIDAEARMIQKTLLFQNSSFIFDEYMTDNVTAAKAKKYSVIGDKLGQPRKQCQHYTLSAINDLIHAGDVVANYNTVNFPEHFVGQFLYKGDWVKMDFDPDEPGFIDSNAVRTSGYASAMDIVNDTLLFHTRYLYADNLGDTLDIANASNSRYRSLYHDAGQQEYIMPNTKKVTGDWTICAGCKLERKQYISTVDFRIDTLDASVKQWYASFKAQMVGYLSTGEEAYRDSSTSILMAQLHITKQQVDDLVNTGNLKLGGHTSDLFQNLWNSNDSVPTVVLTIPAHTDTLVIGRDVKLPFLVKTVSSCINCLIGDSLVSADANWLLWNNATIPTVNVASINYLDSGYMPPQASPTVIELYYNAAIYNFFAGFVVDQGAISDTMIYSNTVTSPSYTDVITSQPALSSLKAYPNLLAAGATATVECNSKFKVFDTEGRELKLTVEPISDGKYRVTFPRTGYYIIYSPGNGSTNVLVF